ncbi:hypothetical protein T439DRAFT_357558 [Meredithblackwellia eburnea MCA 4105]
MSTFQHLPPNDRIQLPTYDEAVRQYRLSTLPNGPVTRTERTTLPQIKGDYLFVLGQIGYLTAQKHDSLPVCIVKQPNGVIERDPIRIRAHEFYNPGRLGVVAAGIREGFLQPALVDSDLVQLKMPPLPHVWDIRCLVTERNSHLFVHIPFAGESTENPNHSHGRYPSIAECGLMLLANDALKALQQRNNYNKAVPLEKKKTLHKIQQLLGSCASHTPLQSTESEVREYLSQSNSTAPGDFEAYEAP